jgi:YD repeat-containing protein
VGDTPTYVATASDPVLNRTLTYAWTVPSGPGAVVFSAPSALTTTAIFPAPGTYVLQFAANDGVATTTASLTVNAALVNQPPVVTVGPDQTLPASTLSTTLVGSATDDGFPLGATLSSTWSLLSGPVAVTIASPTQAGLPEPGPITASTSVAFSYPGTYVFQLSVSDSALVGVATETITINPPAAATGGGGTTGGSTGTTTGGSTGTTTGGGTGTTPSAPTVAIGGVTDDQEITLPTPILATVSDGSWVLEWRLGGRDDVQTPWAVMASGTGALNNTTIATFDPTLLLNGIYSLRLSATNSVGSATTGVSLSVDGRMKVGFFTLAFTDLNTAVGGLPLTVTRTYDSRDKSVGDFGFGWKLGISDVRVEKSGKTGAYWDQEFIDEDVFSEFCLIPTQASSVAITFPSGRQYRFTPQASPQCTAEFEDTAPDIIWVSTSDPNNPTITLVAAGQNSVFANDVGDGVTQLQDDNADIWDPRQFTLTIEDGSVWQIDQDLGVTSVRDLNGNTLTITPNGIVQSSGKQVTFARDVQGRITSITDPNGASMTYAYDGNGNLATYTDRLANVTQFTYDANHYLDQIQDPLGRLPLRNVYDASGRLLSTTDASGNTVQYNANLAANQEQVTDRLGHVTIYTYNDRGDVTQKVDATGATWNYTFDIRGNPLTTTDPLGNTTTRTYDGADDLLTQTDALGNLTTNTYDGYKDLLTTTDPLGHVTIDTYAGAGNIVTATDALGSPRWILSTTCPLTHTTPRATSPRRPTRPGKRQTTRMTRTGTRRAKAGYEPTTLARTLLRCRLTSTTR